MTTQRGPGRRFAKGVSGNPKGRPRGIVGPTGEVRELAKRYSSRAIERLAWLMEHGKPDGVQASAAVAILDRACGRPVPAFQAEGQGAGQGALIVNILRNPQPAAPAEVQGDQPMARHAVALLGDGSREALRDELLRRLPEDERLVVEILIRAHPNAVALDVLSEATGFPPAVLDRYLNRLQCSHFVASEGRGAVRAAPELF
jgi:hypothetical protein